MHIVTTVNPIPIRGGATLLPGTFLMEDMDLAELINGCGGGEVEAKVFRSDAKITLLGDGGDQVVTVVRPGRYGDLVLLTPCLREIKRRWPRVTLQVCCMPRYREVLDGLPYVDSFIPYPAPLDEKATEYGQMLCLEPLASLVKREGEIHMTDLFAERLGLEGMQQKKPDFILTMDEIAWAHDAYPRGKAKRVAIQIKSTTPSRDYPMLPMGEVVRRLFGRGWDVLLLGLPNQISGTSKDRLVNCAADRLTFRQSAAVLNTADVFFGPDSSLIHIAGALGVPAVGVFSVVPWELRTTYCPTTFVIQAKKGCDIAPCFHQPKNAIGFPADGPCNKDRKCSALNLIEPHEIVGRIEQHAETQRVAG